jgi:transposase
MCMTSKRSFNLSEQQKRELKAAFRESRDGAERTRLQAVRLYGSGYPVEEVIEVTDCSRRSLLRWSQRYRRDGIGGLQDRREGGNRALLDEVQLADVRAKLHQYRPVDVLGPEGVATASGQHWTVPDLKRALQQWYNLVYQSSSSYRQLFARCDFSYQRLARVFRSRSVEQVADFAEQLEKN